MYKFLIAYTNKPIANMLMGLWYLFLIMVNIYCSVSAATQGAFQYVGW